MSYFVQETKTQEQSEREAEHKKESKHFNANWNIYFNEHLREAPQNEKQHHTQNEKRTTSSDDVGFLDESSKSDIFSRSVYLVLVSPPVWVSKTGSTAASMGPECNYVGTQPRRDRTAALASSW